MTNGLGAWGLRAGSALAVLLFCMIQPASAGEAHKRLADAHALVSTDASVSSRPAPPSTRRPASSSAKGPYYVDFRARTAASWGHAFVWYGKTSERAVEVAGLTPAGDTLAYVLGHLTWVPSETGASYGDLDPEYLTASYRVYLNEPDARRVFAYIKQLQASSPVWNAETTNCTGFIGNIAGFMGLKVPPRWQRPENFVNSLKQMNGARRMVQLSPEQ
ncbi:MAG: hypothetical protein KGM94_11915 [Bradyrhizobium sp.]|nr:hypothetical protein [Bradyrhizobium sp.]